MDSPIDAMEPEAPITASATRPRASEEPCAFATGAANGAVAAAVAMNNAETRRRKVFDVVMMGPSRAAGVRGNAVKSRVTQFSPKN